jgi:hypothetical protein
LTRLCGIALLTAGAQRHPGPPTSRRPSNDALLTACTGVAPLEASSTGIIRHRLNRGSKRELNTIVYRTAITPGEREHDHSGCGMRLQGLHRESNLALAGCRVNEAVRQMVKQPVPLLRSVRKCTA